MIHQGWKNMLPINEDDEKVIKEMNELKSIFDYLENIGLKFENYIEIQTYSNSIEFSVKYDPKKNALLNRSENRVFAHFEHLSSMYIFREIENHNIRSRNA